MTKQTEALKMAIEALEDYPYEHRTAKMDDAIQACKEALERPTNMVAVPAQKPVIIAIAQNEPPRVMLQDRVNGKYMCFDVDSFVQAHLATEQINGFFNAITHPAPSWQGLREEEMMKLANKYIDLLPNGELFHFDLFARAIEQALKEKNT